MPDTATPGRRGWRHLERYAYVARAYDDVWTWVAGHLSVLGAPLPGGGHSIELRVRPGGVEISRPVRLDVGGLVAGEDRARASLAWADASRPHLFPRLEAGLEIAPVPNDSRPFTQLGVLARYRPPFGPLGALGDRLLGHEVTETSLATFLDELATAVADHTVPSETVDADRPSPQGEEADYERALLTIGSLGTRPGGAVGAGEALAGVPGVVHVSLDPFTGLVAVDHDPARCGSDELMAALAGEASVRLVG